MRAAIFDMDGTLVDSMPYWRGHLAGYLTDLGLAIPDDLEVKVNQGGSFKLLFAEISRRDPSITMDDIIAAYHDRMRPEYRYHIKAKDNVRPYLDQLKKEGIPMCIATATPRELFMPMLERIDFTSYFDFYITVPEIGIGKSEPDIYQYCANQYGLDVADCTVFEDTIQAITTAKNAGFYTIGVADQTSAWAEDRICAVCDRFIDSFEELL